LLSAFFLANAFISLPLGFEVAFADDEVYFFICDYILR
jgi:hypothetical protein